MSRASAPPPRRSDPPSTRARSSVETRRRLLDAAELEFAQKGFAGARLRDVAATAGVQQALIHHYFGDKSGLYRAVLDRAIAETAEGGWRILEQQGDVRSTIEAFVELLVRFSATHANLLSILRLEASSGAGGALDVMSERTRPILDAVEAKIIAWQAAGVARPRVAAREIIVATLALTLFPYQEAKLLDALWPGSRERADDEAAITRRRQLVVDVVTRGLLDA